MLTSTQVGLLAENLVTNALLVESDGRFAPFRPVADDRGIDLLVYDKSSGRATPLQVKGRSKTLKKAGSEERGDTVHFEMRKAALREKEHTQLLAVLLDEAMTKVLVAWLIPLSEFERIGAQKADKIVIRPSSSPATKDKYVHRLSMQGLVKKLTEQFEQHGGSDGACPMNDSQE